MYQEIARWEARGAKRWLALYVDDTADGKRAYLYRGQGCGGNLGYMESDLAAIQHMEANAVAVLRADFPSTARVELPDTGWSEDMLTPPY